MKGALKHIRQVIYLLGLIGLSFLFSCKSSDTGLGFMNQRPLAVKEVIFYSNSLERDMAINVILPKEYGKSDLSYPVLYLCHGFTSNYHEFKYVGAPEYGNMFDMIIVMVDVGNSSYVNWAQSDDGRPYNFADHVCIDVINYVDKNYRTISKREGRAINGISMGGGGAISIGLSHPDLFCSIGSHSGSIGSFKRARERILKGEKPRDMSRIKKDTTMRYRDIDLPGFSTMKERTPNGQPFVTVEDVDKVDPYKLILTLPKEKIPHIYFDCGYQDFLSPDAKAFLEFLETNEIPFQCGMSAGGHEEDYWGRELIVSMSVQYAVMLRNIWGKEFEVYDAWKK
jgi:S-formylglutathione hydrolase FrmB